MTNAAASPVFLPHFQYEVRMLIHAARRLTAFDAIADPGLAEQADRLLFLEAFLVHARVLDEYFQAERSRPDDDARASDAVPGWKIPRDCWPGDERRHDPRGKERLGVLAKCDVTRINKQLGHPTKTRIDKQDFPVRTMATTLVTVARHFSEEAGLPSPFIGELKDFLSDPQVLERSGS